MSFEFRHNSGFPDIRPFTDASSSSLRRWQTAWSVSLAQLAIRQPAFTAVWPVVQQPAWQAAWCQQRSFALANVTSLVFSLKDSFALRFRRLCAGVLVHLGESFAVGATQPTGMANSDGKVNRQERLAFTASLDQTQGQRSESVHLSTFTPADPVLLGKMPAPRIYLRISERRNEKDESE